MVWVFRWQFSLWHMLYNYNDKCIKDTFVYYLLILRSLYERDTLKNLCYSDWLMRSYYIVNHASMSCLYLINLLVINLFLCLCYYAFFVGEIASWFHVCIAVLTNFIKLRQFQFWNGKIFYVLCTVIISFEKWLIWNYVQFEI